MLSVWNIYHYIRTPYMHLYRLAYSCMHLRHVLGNDVRRLTWSLWHKLSSVCPYLQSYSRQLDQEQQGT